MSNAILCISHILTSSQLYEGGKLIIPIFKKKNKREKETEPQRGYVTYTKSHSKKMAKLGTEQSLDFRACAPIGSSVLPRAEEKVIHENDSDLGRTSGRGHRQKQGKCGKVLGVVSGESGKVTKGQMRNGSEI